MASRTPAESLSTPLSDDEITELNERLLAADEDRDPLDVVMLDGFLTGVLLQPEVVSPSAWLPLVFDAQGRAPAHPADPATTKRTHDLILRRHHEIAAHIVAREPFDPIVFEMEDPDGKLLDGKAAIAALEPWTVGFMNALTSFPDALDRLENDDEGAGSLLGILRHLPADPEDTGDTPALLGREKIDRQLPLVDLDDAIDELVACIMEIADITVARTPIARLAPKVGRNAPCPCGSGRKFKQCHGQSVH